MFNKTKIACTCLLSLCPVAQAVAAPYELTVYSRDMAAPGETEFETIFSLARPTSRSHLSGRIGQMLAEVNYGIALGWEVGVQVPAVYSNQRRKVQGVALELQYVAPHDKASGWYWGIRGEVGRTASVYEDDTARSIEINPIIGYRGTNYRFVFNPSLDKALTGSETTTRFHPSAKLAMPLAAKDEIGMEYYADWGSVKKLSPSSKRDESLYLVWDKLTSFGRFNIGLGQALRPTLGSADKWVAKIGIQFDTD